MRRGGRPLRFLALVALGWIGMRAALLWPQIHSLPDALHAVVPFAALPQPNPERAAAPAPPPTALAPLGTFARAALPAPPPRRAADPMRVQLALLNLLQFGDPEYVDAPPIFAAPVPAPFQQRRAGPVAGRWSASGWLVARAGSGVGAAPDGSQLGGSQAGVRLNFMLDRERRIALYGRFAAPLSGEGREAAFGVDWQPTRLPVRLIAEQRIGVDGQRGGSAAGLVAGIDTRLPRGFALESYGQAGAILRGRVDPYADGSARLTRPLAREGRLDFALGVGAWGAAQRDASRFDMGPSATLALPVAGQRLRVALDWRQRIAGDARPGSGLALTIGGDF